MPRFDPRGKSEPGAGRIALRAIDPASDKIKRRRIRLDCLEHSRREITLRTYLRSINQLAPS
jgi:hypothetical protein